MNIVRLRVIPEMGIAYKVASTQYPPITWQPEEGYQLELTMAMWGLVPRCRTKPLAEKNFFTFDVKSDEAAGEGLVSHRLEEASLSCAYERLL